MTLDVCSEQPTQPQSIGALVQIYDGPDIRVCRFGFDGTQALIRFGIGEGTGACVVRPWQWTDSQPLDSRYQGYMSHQNLDLVNGWLSQKSRAVTKMDFASALLWSCRRAPREHRRRSEWGYIEDAQRVGPRAFNRFLIREALQTWVQMGIAPKDVLRIEAICTPEPTLRLSSGRTWALVVALKSEVEAGDDPWLTEWPCDVFGQVEQAPNG